MFAAVLLRRTINPQVACFYLHNIRLSPHSVGEELVLVDAVATDVKVTVDAAVLRHKPVPFTYVARSDVRAGPNLVLNTVDVEVWREIFHTTPRDAYIGSTLWTSVP